MSRTVRVVVTFAFGAAVAFAGLTIATSGGKVQGAILSATGHYVNADSLREAAAALLLGGLAIEGLALLGWILAPRDDR